MQHAFGVKLGGPVSPPLATETIPWKGAARRVFGYAFVLVLGVAGFSLCYFTLLLFKGTVAPTASAAEPLISHGRVIYVTLFEKRLLDGMWLLIAVGMPALGVVALFLHFVLGIKLFSRTWLN